jgi:hypothetical protein
MVAVVAVLAVGVVLVLRWSPASVVISPRCLAHVQGTTYDLAPEQAANAATIAAISVRRGLPARAATIGIATAMQESKLRNLDYGDRDSLGLFQQRPSQGWGTPEQVRDPVYATNAFYDVLTKVAGYENMEVTDASHRVQRSAFPKAVANHEPLGRAFASGLTGHSPGTLTCRLRAADGAGDVAAVQQLLARDFGEVTAQTDPEHPALLRLPVDVGSDAGRLRAWALAQWAVAQAEPLKVVRVTVDGQQWRRDRPDDGWVADAAAPADAVVVEVAGSAR